MIRLKIVVAKIQNMEKMRLNDILILVNEIFLLKGIILRLYSKK